jgi:hypothetical protein
MEREQDKHLVTEKQKAVLLNTFLMDMGRKFKVLIQEKGMGHPHLSGLQFSTKRLF